LPFGLSLSLLAGILPLFAGYPFMTGLWYPDPAPVIGMLGTALLFDLGVYFVVIGVTLLIIFTLAETSENPWN
jgi:multicomponent Na+:H+ antiporter subunit B